MEQLSIKPYEISIWKDKLVEGETYYEEVMLAKIGSNKTSSPNECFNIALKKNINGEITLSFSMTHQYFDENIGEKVENPFIPYLVNERKVKLKYDNKWYDFIIKNIEENSEDNIFNYECVNLFVNELSKGGYNVTLSTDLANNQGTILDLAEKVIEPTNWVVDRIESDKIRGYIQEPLYYGKVKSGTTIKVINAIPSERPPENSGEETLAAEEEIYFFYSTIANKQIKNVHILRAKDKEDKWIEDDNKVVKGPNYRIIENISYGNDSNIPTFVENFKLITDFQGYRITYNSDSKWDPVTERYVDIYKAGDREIYHYTDFEYTTSDILTNFITSGHNFEFDGEGAAPGWSVTTPHTSDEVEQSADIVAYPNTNEDTSMSLADLTATKNYLRLHFNGHRTKTKNEVTANTYYNTIFNSGIQDNAGIIDGFSKGEKYIFRVKYGITTKDNPTGTKGAPKPEKPKEKDGSSLRRFNQHLRVLIAGYTVTSAGNRKPNLSKIYFDTGYYTDAKGPLNNTIKGGEIVQKNRVYRVKNDYGYDIYAPSTDNFYQVSDGQGNVTTYIWDPRAINPADNKEGAFIKESNLKDLQYYYYEMTCKKSLSSKALSESDIGIFVYTNRANGDSADPESRYYYWVDDIQIFKRRVDGNNKIITIGNIPTATTTTLEYYYLPNSDIKDASEINRYSTLEALAEDLGCEETDIVLSYNDECEKISSIEVEHSNYFDIIQDLCEKFECWVEFKVDHDEETGKILLDEETHKPNKKIIFHQFIGKDNFAGFKYGINLDSIQRTHASDEIVTKLIVEQNENEYMENGFLSIAQAPSNPYGTNYIYNFNYYINHDLIDSDSFFEDIGNFEETIKSKTIELNELNQEYIKLQQSITKISGEKVVYNEYLKAARLDLNETKKLIKQISGKSYNDFVNSNGSDLKMTIIPTHKENGQTVAAKVTVSLSGISGLKVVDRDGKEIRPQNGGKIYYTPGAEKDSSKYQYFKITGLPTGYNYPFKKNASNNIIGTSSKNTKFYLQDTHFFKPKDTSDATKGVYCWLPLLDDSAMETLVEYFGKIIADQTVINGYSGTVSNLNAEYKKLVQEADGAPRYTFNIAVRDGYTTLETDDFVENFEVKILKPGGIWETCTFSTIDKIFEKDFSASQWKFTTPTNYELYDTNNDTVLTPNTPYNLEEDITYAYELRPQEGSELAKGGLKYKIEQLEQEIKDLEKDFYEKYSRFIQEGTWTSDEYVDNELYYLDAVQISNTSAVPKVEYSIKVLEVSELEGLENYIFDIGDKTYIEDTEFFGWKPIGGIRTPIREEVIVSEATWRLDEPEENEIIIQNYKTRFEDLFQRIGATVQTVEYNNGSYMRAASALDTNGLINSDLLTSSLNNIAGIGFLLSADGKVEIDSNGVTVTDLAQTNNKVRLGGKGLMVSDDGGQNWDIALTPQGIDTKYIRAGAIDAGQINIIDGENPSFRWDSSGITAFSLKNDREEDEGEYDYTKFVRFDKYGLYGIDGIDGLTGFNPTQLDEVKNEAVFGAVWDEFFVKSKYEDGYVSMSSKDDFTVVRQNGDEKVNVVKIGNIDSKLVTTENYEEITEGIYVLTTDNAPVSGKIYYELVETEDRYELVTNPVIDDIDTYYELVYVPTEDTEIITGKDYYVANVTYEPVLNPVLEDLENYYEYVEGEYILTQDTEIIEGKTYYTSNVTYELVLNPVESELENYYELVYIKTTDTEIDPNKDYYIFIIGDNSYEAISPAPFSLEGLYEKVLNYQNGSTYYTKVDNLYFELELTDEDYRKTLDTTVDLSKTYFIKENDEYIVVENPIDEDLSDYYEVILNIDLETVYIATTDTTEESIYGIVIRSKDDDENEWRFRADSEGNLELTGSAQSRNYAQGISGWRIDQDGDAEFSNVTVRGSIHAAVFEYTEVQAVGGAIYVRPSSTITEVVNYDAANHILECRVENPDILTGNFCRISDKPASNNVYDYSKINNTEPIIIYGYEPEDENSLARLVGAAFIDLGEFDQNTTKNNYAISINSSEASVAGAPKAITLYESNYSKNNNVINVTNKINGVFGTLPPLGSDLVDSNIYDYMKETQGIYTNNMYLGDNNQYVAFYTKNDTQKKVLKIKADVEASNFKAVDTNNIVRAEVNESGLIVYDSNHNPITQYGNDIIIGNEDSTHIKITPTEMGFYQGRGLNSRVAYINNNEMTIPYTVVTKGMKLSDKWEWKINTDNHLTLTWIG